MSESPSAPSETTRLEVGVITRPHGLTGELRVHLHWAASEVLFEVEQVWVTQGHTERRVGVLSARPGNRVVLLRLGGVSTREQAEALRGARLSVERDALPPLEPGEYYLADLVGMQVEAPDGVVGRVTEICNYPTVDAVVIQLPDGTKVEQPLLDPWLDRVDLESRRIVLSSRDGFLE